MAEHYYTEKQTSDDKRFPIHINLKKDKFDLISSSGLFSKDELDSATALLINSAVVGKNILDMGCGYGVVGIAILRMNKREADIKMTFSDINERAIEITRENLEKHHLSGNVVKSDLFENIPEQFDTILSNPPYAAGREVCFKLIEQSYEHLLEGGTLQLVARHNKGGSVLSEKMNDVFGNVTAIAKSGGFRVYLSVRKE